ncbi:MAG: hypothetical protein FWC61_01120 [Proteobacteria bacterium]|nr:hypothetical protein [Pseudomonadota bacterium]
MRKLFLGLFGFFTCAVVFQAGGATTPWWLQATICQINPSKCYAAMGKGYAFDTSDVSTWDITSNCWGKKLICGDALTPAGFYINPRAMTKTEIAAGTGISSDFDISVLGPTNDCFGARKTASGGSQVMAGGTMVNVWCMGVLSNPDERVANGEIIYPTSAPQPTCASLAADGYVAILNGSCYGKYFDPNQYFIECVSGQLLPTRVVALNGADAYIGATSSSVTYPTDQAAADALFNAMQQTAAGLRSSHFNQ